MKTAWIAQVFDTVKPVIAMAHIPALPGAPLYEIKGGMEPIVEHVKRDLDALQGAGVDGVMFCNENDRPYQFTAQASTIAAMAYVIGRVKSGISVPFGVDILWDPVSAVALAHSVGARFVREVFTGVYESDMGLWHSRAAEAVRLRAQLGAAEDIRLLFNVSAEFASPFGRRSIAEIAQSVAFSSLPDGICVSGPMTGSPVAASELERVTSLLEDTPVFVNTGVRRDNVEKYLAVADGAIVGTALKYEGKTFNAVDADRAKQLMVQVKNLRLQLAT
ncbi:MAG: BtpA/SgcQ family protein [Thermaerobacter sp.]|nr:BtpA/SgcQ family protein [Thermaerobacter sp.]